MKGDIVVQTGEYLEIILEEEGSSRLIVCLDFRERDPEPVTVRRYRIEYQDAAGSGQQTVSDIEDALALFRLLRRKVLPLWEERREQ